MVRVELAKESENQGSNQKSPKVTGAVKGGRSVSLLRTTRKMKMEKSLFDLATWTSVWLQREHLLWNDGVEARRGFSKHSCQSECLADCPAKLYVSFSVGLGRSLAFHNIVLFRVKNSVIYSLINILSLSQNKYILNTQHGQCPWWWRLILLPSLQDNWTSTQLTSTQSVPSALQVLPEGIELGLSFEASGRQTL